MRRHREELDEEEEEEDSDERLRRSVKRPRPEPRETNFRKYNNKLARFDGSTDYEIWWCDAKSYVKQFEDISEKEKVKMLTTAIVGNAKLVLESEGDTFTTAQGIHGKMRKSFVNRTNWIAKLHSTFQQATESVD